MNHSDNDSSNGQPIEDSQAPEVTAVERKNRARRKILRSLVVGGGAVSAASVTPKEWSRPVVEAVVLPSHAATSVGAGGINPFGVFTSGAVVVGAAQPTDTRITDANDSGAVIPALSADESISPELLEFFMPTANAAFLCNVACSIDVTADIQNAGVNVCISGDIFESLFASFNPGSPPTINPTGGSYVAIDGGQFSGGKWRFDVRTFFPNTSTVVTLSRGGSLNCFEDDNSSDLFIIN